MRGNATSIKRRVHARSVRPVDGNELAACGLSKVAFSSYERDKRSRPRKYGKRMDNNVHRGLTEDSRSHRIAGPVPSP
jgi:hypothetical protein